MANYAIVVITPDEIILIPVDDNGHGASICDGVVTYIQDHNPPVVPPDAPPDTPPIDPRTTDLQ